MGHHCCTKQKVKRGLWSPEEDKKLFDYITAHGHGSWSSIPKLAELQRCGKSCRLRWINYLRPDLKKGSFTEEEETTIIEVHRILGNRWAQIAKHLPGRTDNEVKNFWNSCIKKRLIAQGLDPNTHNLLKKNPNNASKTPNIQANSSSLGFSIEPIEVSFASPTIVELEDANNFVLNDAKDENTQNPNTTIPDSLSHVNVCGYNTVVDDEGAMWSLQNIEQPIISEVEAQYGLKNMEYFDGSMDSQSSELGFGVYSPTIIPGCLYGDMTTSVMDYVAWENC